MFKLLDPVYECVFDLDFSCKFSKLQYNNLAFFADFKRATDEGLLPEIAQYSPYYLPLNVLIASKGSHLYIFILYIFKEQIFQYSKSDFFRKVNFIKILPEIRKLGHFEFEKLMKNLI